MSVLAAASPVVQAAEVYLSKAEKPMSRTIRKQQVIRPAMVGQRIFQSDSMRSKQKQNKVQWCAMSEGLRPRSREPMEGSAEQLSPQAVT